MSEHTYGTIQRQNLEVEVVQSINFIYIYFIYLVSELVSLHPNLFHIDIFRIFSSTRQMGEPRRTTEQCSVRK